MLSQAVEESKQSGIIRQWASPWILEMLFEFHRLGFDPIADMSYQSQVERVFREPNVHLKGVALRLRAKEAVAKGEDKAQIQSLLEASEQDLKRSGDPVELSKTLMEMARLEVSRGDRERARELAQKAWEGLSGYTEEFFSDDLRHLLQMQRPSAVAMRMLSTAESIFGRFLDMMEELIPSEHLSEIMVRAVGVTNRFLGAERGGLFWFPDAKKNKTPRLRAACNLTEKEVNSETFRSNLSLITKCFSEGKPFLVRPPYPGQSQERKGARAILCLPVEVGGKVRGVLYHDNSYLDDCFDFLDGPLLVRVIRHLSKIVDRVWDYERLMQEKSWRVSDEAMQGQGAEKGEMLARSPITVKLLIDAARAAQSESNILLLGETGVGKEILARHIHKRSPRRDRHYVIIDIPTIPGNLLESELFGHEKGAFTGADHQKRGRIELAHGGTLFLDEIGELPLPIQSKLLRMLEEKAFVRLGGSQVISSDFRLVAATNRDLAKDAAEGRFRKDLYYRINVVPMTIPPLRERKEDIILLARHYLNSYARKLNSSPPELTSADEARLTAYQWPGNVRELKNVMERAVLLSTDDHLKLDLPLDPKSESAHSFSDFPKMDELQRRYIQFVLNRTGNRISGKGGAAELMGMDRLTLYRRMKKLDLR